MIKKPYFSAHTNEFYETPQAFTRWALSVVAPSRATQVTVFEPCVGDGAIVRGVTDYWGSRNVIIETNDLDPAREATHHLDATKPEVWDEVGPVDWVIANPPFSVALEMIEQARRIAQRGILFHVRCTFNEPLKRGPRRNFLRDDMPPTGMLWLPRFMYRESKKTGKLGADSATCVWLYWDMRPTGGWGTDMGNADDRDDQFIAYAPDWVFDELAEIQRIRRGRRKDQKPKDPAPQTDAPLPLDPDAGGRRRRTAGADLNSRPQTFNVAMAPWDGLCGGAVSASHTRQVEAVRDSEAQRASFGEVDTGKSQASG